MKHGAVVFIGFVVANAVVLAFQGATFTPYTIVRTALIAGFATVVMLAVEHIYSRTSSRGSPASED